MCAMTRRDSIPPKSNPTLRRRAISRRTACFGLGAFAFAASVGGARAAPDWPHRPVTVIVPYAPGGNTDMMARLASQYLSEKLGQPFVIENRAGGSGSIGAIGAARAAPDGYTLMFGASTQIINIPLMQKVAYDPKDFVPISIFGAGPYLLGVKGSLPVNTLQEFIAYVKANPGKLNYGTAGYGGNVHLNSALFNARFGLDIVAVPYKSGAPAMAGLAAGEVDMYFGNASEVVQFADSPLVKILAVSTKQRLPQLPNVPTVDEFYPGYDTSSWNGFFAPTGTPQPIIDLIATHVIAAAKDPIIADRLNKLTILPFGTTQAEFKEIIARSRISVRESMKAAGLPIIE
jgi:tripartite-type tricarboxylate transporter receptor subunit TctC